MPRYKRIREPGLLHHVMSRGNARMRIFLDDEDYRKFLYILADVLDDYEVDCWDMCLMPNHYHLALMNSRANLPEAMQHLNGEYGSWWNGRHTNIGHVFQGRYKDQIVQREGYLLNLIRYIALNPVRAGLAASPELWPWSAYSCAAGLAPNPGFLRPELLLHAFGDGDVAMLRHRYVRHVLSRVGDDNESYKQFRSRQRILGDGPFKRALRKKLADQIETTTAVAPIVAIGFP